MLRNIIILFIIISALAITAKEIDLSNLYSYADQSVPQYITKDNTRNNEITDAGATLGRVLFYDKKLSKDNSIACASCHQQEFAFGDTALASKGVAGVTGRHSMRLVNARFADEASFFWDKRAQTLEQQTTMPIQDHIEMGYSGTDGDESIEDLITKLENVPYYASLFTLAFGDAEINETRMQRAMAQFVRSIQSFDSRYDTGRASTANEAQNFQNFTNSENQGKQLFLTPPQFNQNGERLAGGLGCAGCHRPPEFDIDPQSLSNGVFGKLENGEIGAGYDISSTRAPSLRDIFNPEGELNGPMMHSGEFTTLSQVLDHYNEIIIPEDSLIRYLDRRFALPGGLQKLNITNQEKQSIEAFLKTLTGTEIYTNEIWSSPFDQNDSLTLVNDPNWNTINTYDSEISIYPNPVIDFLKIESMDVVSAIITDINGRKLTEKNISAYDEINMTKFNPGTYFLWVYTKNGNPKVYPILKK